MKTELIDISPTRKEIKIEIEPAIVRQTYDRVSDRYTKLANVPGFRRGHAPRGVVRTRFKSEIRGEVLRELLPEAVNEAIDKHELTAIGEPNVQFDEAEKFEQFGDQPISVKVAVEVLPKVELGNYKGFKAARRVRPVTDEDVQKMIDGLRESSASLLPVEERGAQLGDTVSQDVVGAFLDRPDEEPIDVKEVDVILGDEGVQQEFTDNLLGVKPDDKKIFTVDYPTDFSSPRLAGRKVEYAATVTAVRMKELPELDDEWAKSLGEDFDSVETLRTKIREDLEQRANVEADHRVRSALLRSLLEAHQFEVPETLVQHQTSTRLQEVVQNMIGRGIDPRNQELDWERAREELQTQAQEDVRASMLLELIADQEQIEVTDEEIEAELNQIASASRQPLERVRATLTKDGGNRSIANRLRNRKALDLLTQNAQVSEEEWRDEDRNQMKAEGTD
ncbi:MAG TPA: trigger factor [Pyrinomonadaceae bacterium]|nr:trigger factor [Pyrinomonadaceae bacterium]